MEKCFQIALSARGRTPALEEDHAALFRAVLGQEAGKGKSGSLSKIANDRFGNYVVQSLIACSTGQERAELQRALLPMQGMLRNTSGGRHVLKAMQRELWTHG